MLSLPDVISKAEKKYLNVTEEFFTEIWGDTRLWSHDLSHHRRVWEYAKEILSFSSDILEDNLTAFSTKLLISCYFHDIGMSADPGSNHGNLSRKLCEKFLHLNHIDVSDSRDLLQAIEDHDNKDYAWKKKNDNLLTILSAADDLDAFGFVGICRYSEIYLIRGSDPSVIGYLIRENGARRFENFQSLYGMYGNLYKKHKRRYLVLDDFFKEYNREITNYQFGIQEPSGHCGIIEIMSNHIRYSIPVVELISRPVKYSDNVFITGFFDSVRSEIER
jgi:HD superfamily phosphodiesterase